jgi:hypothetical protein
MTRTKTVLIAVLGGAACLAGCGDSEPPRRAFAPAADVICKRANVARQDLQRRGLTYPAPRGAAELVGLLRELESTYRRAIGGLRGLDPPKADAAAVVRMLDDFEYSLNNFAPFIEAVADGNEEKGTGIYFGWLESLRPAHDIAAKTGLRDCAVFGNP